VRSRTVWSFALLVVLVAAVSLPAGVSWGKLPGPRDGGPPPPPGEPTRQFNEMLAKRARAEAARVRAFEEKLKTPAEQAERERSRTAYRNLAPPDAVAVVRNHHPEILKAPLYSPTKVEAGQKFERFTGDYGATISGVGPKGESVLRVSMLPMRVDEGEGRKEPVDLTLEDAVDVFRPRTPLQTVSMAKQSAVGVTLPGGFTLAPVGEDVSATLEDNAVFYANVNTDTDWVVRPDPMGIEAYFVLRSQDSPEQLRMHVGLQPGAKLELGDDDDILIKMNGKTIGHITPPRTWDGNDQPVATETEIDGSDIVLTVRHQGRDVAYPLQVDPEVTAGFYFQYQGDEVWSYWGWYDSTGTGYGSTTGKFGHFGGNAYAGRSLYINVPYPGQYFNGYPACCGYEKAFWYFRGPGNGRIYHVRMNSSNNDVPGSLQLCAFWGIANANIDSFEGGANGEGCGPHYNFGYDFWNNSHTPGNVWLLGEYAYSTGTWYGNAYHRDAQIDMFDYDDPTGVAITAPKTGEEFNLDPDGQIGVVAQDASLGITKVTFTGPAEWSGNGRTISFLCPVGVCPQRIPANGVPDPVTGQVQPAPSVPIENMPDGRRRITATVTDAADHTVSTYADLKFDHNWPVLTISGSLWDHRDGTLPPGSHALNVRAEDAGSGPAYVKITIDGIQVAATPAYSCSDPDAPCDVSYTFNTAEWPAEVHEVVIETNDHGHGLEAEIEAFTIDTRQAADSTGPAFEDGLNAQALIQPDSGQAQVDWSAAGDPALADGSESDGIQYYRYRYRRNAGSWTSWATTEFPEFAASGWLVGDTVNLEVAAVDAAGNEGPVAAATLSVSLAVGAQACQLDELSDRPYPAWCETVSEEEDTDADPEIDVQPVATLSGQYRRSTQTYRVRVKGGEWTTPRGWWRSWAIGVAHDGDRLQSRQHKSGYILGNLESLDWRCAWVGATLLEPAGRGNSDCEPDMRWLPREFQHMNNCPKVMPAGQTCKDGLRITLVRTSPACRDVGLRRNGKTGRCKKLTDPAPGGGRQVRTVQAGQCVKWRYLTKDKRFVMVADQRYGRGDAHWYFIKASALPSHRRWGKGVGNCP
jgi:hypothetical protein